jgi:hypothetical protein
MNNRASFPIPLANGTFDQVIPGLAPGYHQIVFTYAAKPTAGRMAIFTKTGIDDDWLPLAEAQNLDMTTGRIAIAFGAISAYRFVISGLSGGSTLTAWLSSALEWPGPGMPEGLFVGLRAMTFQTFVEANVKNGVEYELAGDTPALAIGGVINTIFTTGPKPVIIKSRIVKFSGASLPTRVYRGPTYSGGAITPYFNLNDRNPVAGGVVVRTGVTVSAVGTEFGAPTFDIGSVGVGNSSLGTFSVIGIERLLAPNTTYLQQILNDSAAIQRVTSYLTWYEGGTDLPLN